MEGPNSQLLVVPGQILATTNRDENQADAGFLRGHGTYVDYTYSSGSPDATPGDAEEKLVASVTGVVQRVNKLVSVHSVLSDSVYSPQVGDLVVGRVTAVNAQRWTVELTRNNVTSASLPLSGVHLGGIQRMRTAQDARDMRDFLKVGDLVSAEVLKAPTLTQVVLHTRSLRYGKLENGTLVSVPPQLVGRRKNHYMTGVLGKFDILFGCNGKIWMQRTIKDNSNTNSNTDDTATTTTTSAAGIELVELQQEQRETHANNPLSNDERADLARLRNSITCLRLVQRQITVDAVEQVYRNSERLQLPPSHMQWPENVVALTCNPTPGGE